MNQLLRNAWTRDDTGNCAGLLASSAAISTLVFIGSVVLAGFFPELAANSTKSLEVELWSASVALSLIALGALALRREKLGAAGLVTLIGALAIVVIVRETAMVSWDYECFANAGRLITADADIYGWTTSNRTPGGTRYWYSPVLASIFSLLQRIPDDHVPAPAFLAWTAVLYWSACAFVPLLTAVLRRVYGMGLTGSVLAALTLGVATTPFLRTSLYSQPNTLVLDLMLGFLLLSRRREVAASGLLAFAALLKTSPFIMVALLVWDRRWRALAWFWGWCCVLAAGTIAWTGWGPWPGYVRALVSIRSDAFFRDNSLESFLRTTLRLAADWDAPGVAHYAGEALAIALVAGVAWSYARRCWAWPWLPRMPQPHLRTEREFPFALVAMTLLSPLIWEHHWVWMALPCALVLQGLSARGSLLAVAGTALIFFVPTFDLFPFSHHRLLGALLIVVALLRPSGAGATGDASVAAG